MKKENDIEDLLKRYRSDPGQRVSRAVIARFREEHGKEREGGTSVAIWRRAMPVYLVTVITIIVAGASFFAGGLFLQEKGAREGLQEPLQQTEIIESQELKWEVAENDVL